MRRLSLQLENFANDESANITIEFVVILPLLTLWYIGTLVFFDAYKSRMAADNAASVIADILSRFEPSPLKPGYEQDEIDEMLLLRTSMLPKAPPGGWLRVSAIEYVDATGTYKVNWTCVGTGGTVGPLDHADIPLNSIPLMIDGEVVLLVESEVPYVPLVDWVGISITSWTSLAAIKPRFAEGAPIKSGDCIVPAPPVT